MNPIEAAAKGKTLPLIFFSILLGISINLLPKDLNKLAVSFLMQCIKIYSKNNNLDYKISSCWSICFNI